MNNTNPEQSDHDLLVSLNSTSKLNFEQIRSDIKDLKEGTADRIACLEKEKVNRDELQEVQVKVNQIQKHINENIETRLRTVENCSLTREEYSDKHDDLVKQIAGIQKWMYMIMGGLALIEVLLRFIKL
jgi:hypothetical protein